MSNEVIIDGGYMAMVVAIIKDAFSHPFQRTIIRNKESLWSAEIGEGPPQPRKKIFADSSQHYKWALIAVIVTPLILGLIYLTASLAFPSPMPHQLKAIEAIGSAFDFTLKTGFGALVGLLGGKLTRY